MKSLPDPRKTARAQADLILANRDFYLKAPLDRKLMDCPYISREEMISGLESFHKERMQKIPSPTKYPESKAWVAYLLSVDRELQRLACMTDMEMALHRSLNDYTTFRLFTRSVSQVEKCRVVYMPDSDHGQVHIKNVDDPSTHYRPSPPATSLPFDGKHLTWDGVGSGLHIDDEPDEIFPLFINPMYSYYVDDVPSAVEFLTRYSQFWGGGNNVLHDAKKRSVAIEKCSRNFIEVFYPGADGRSHCSGMACRDPQSPQGKYQRAKRDQFVKLFKLPADCSENTFWAACSRAEKMLGDFLDQAGDRPKVDDLVKLFRTPWPKGLCKTGKKIHPNQPIGEYTLVTHYTLIDEKTYVRWQRSVPELEFPEKPEVVRG